MTKEILSPKAVAQAAATLAVIDAEALCEALGIKSDDRLHSAEIIAFVMQRYAVHHAAALLRVDLR